MEFCILSPIAGLTRYSTLSNRHLLLPHLTRSEQYVNFYQERKQAGDFLILDNGAYEGQEDWANLVRCVELFKPQVCALPDYLLQEWEKTHHEAFVFLDRYYYTFPNVKWMYIPQAKPGDIVGFIDSLFRALDDERISWIGLPRALPLEICNDPLMRVRVAEQVRKRSRVNIHALGMMKGNVGELKLLEQAGVKSVDSNAPVWRGWLGYDINGSWHEQPVDYNAPLSATNHTTIMKNLEACNAISSSVGTRD